MILQSRLILGQRSRHSYPHNDQALHEYSVPPWKGLSGLRMDDTVPV